MMIEKKNSRLVLFVLLVLLLVAATIVGLLLLQPPPTILQGEVEATQIRISGKLPGRVVDFWVEEGEKVDAGDTLVHIHSSLVEAQLMSAKAAQVAAEAENTLVDKGARSEVVRSAYEMLMQTKATLSVAQKTYERMQSLYEKGVISEQRRDEAMAAYEVARAANGAARSQYDMLLSGTRPEEKSAAEALVKVAEGGVAEVNSLLEDAYLTAPRSGTVSDIFPQEGELVSLGAPIMNILLLDDVWVTFNVRENLLQYFAIGTELQAFVPALGDRRVMLRVYYIKDMGTYAVWQATRATGEYDAKTFTVRARPVEPVEGLLPGMSVILKESRR